MISHVFVGELRQVGRLCVCECLARGRRVQLIRCCASSLLAFPLRLEQLDHGLPRLAHSDPLD